MNTKYTLNKKLSYVMLFIATLTIPVSLLSNNDDKCNSISYGLDSIYDMANSYIDQNEITKSLEVLYKLAALKDSIEYDCEPKYSNVYNLMGIAYYMQGRNTKALDYFYKVSQYATDNTRLTDSYINISILLTVQGNFIMAQRYLEEALSIWSGSTEKNFSLIADLYFNLGFTHYHSKQYEKSISYYLKTIELTKQHGLTEYGDVYYSCGMAYKELDSLDKADFYLNKAIKSYTKMDGKAHYNVALAYMNYAIFLSDIGKYEDSWDMFQNCHSLLTKTIEEKHVQNSRYNYRVGNLLFKMRRYKEALKHYEDAFILYANFLEDSSYSKTTLDILSVDILKAKAITLEKLAEYENKQENMSNSLIAFQSSVEAIEQLRKGYLSENSKLDIANKEHDTYEAIVRIAHKLYTLTGNREYIETAFNYSEKSKYAVLQDLINDDLAKSSALVPDSIINKEQEIKEEIARFRWLIETENQGTAPDKDKLKDYKKEIFRYNRELDNLVQELERNYPEYHKRKYSQSYTSINKLQSRLSKEEVVVSYELTDSALYCIVITPTKKDFIKTKIEPAFHDRLDFLISFLHSNDFLSYGKYWQSAYYLYSKLIVPINEYTHNKNILIIPDEKLSQIAFEALITEPYQETDDVDYQTLQFLLYKNSIGYIYSASLYADANPSNKKLLRNFVGISPDYKNYCDTLLYIPEVPKNLKRISRFFLFSKTYLYQKATEANLKANTSSADILHIYAYGADNKENSIFSKMFFYSNDTIEDGLLHMHEIEGLDINADLVVLATCLSGSGKVSKGEGVLSMGRSFVKSGTPSIVSSLWYAYIHPTLVELTYFYKFLILGKRKDDAMRLAKIKFLSKIEDPMLAHPKFWASLVVIGNQEALYYGYTVFILPTIIILMILAFFVRKRINPSKYC